MKLVLEYDFQNSVGYWLMTAWRVYQRRLQEEIAPHGITFRQCQVLGNLSMDGPLPQNELAERMQIEPPTLVGILDRMERDGWIRRDGCPQDRRKKLVHPTEAAEPVWAKIAECGRRVRAQVTEGMTTEQVSQLQDLLDMVRQNLETASPRAAVAETETVQT